MTRRARIAVIGAGWWATDNHIPALLANGDADLVALCDADPAKVTRAAAAFGVDRTYTRVEEMLAAENLDGAIVATNHASHYAVARPCLAAGLHLLIEKPMTLHAREARELVHLARVRGCQIALGYNHNYAPYTVRARERVSAGTLGSVQYVHGIFNQHVLPLYRGNGAGFEDKIAGPGDVYSDPVRSGGGHGHLQITHLAGMLFFITGLRAATVQARMHNHGLAVDLVNAILVEFENGGLATIGGTGNMPGGRKIALQVYCERGWVDIDDGESRATIRGEGVETEEFGPGVDAGHISRRHATTSNFVDLILGRAPNGSPGEIGWRVVEMLDAAYRSAARGGAAVALTELYG